MNKRKIKGFENYEITPEGAIFNKGKPLKLQMSEKAAPFVRLRKDGEYHSISVAKLVALTYIPEGRKYDSDIVCYKDGNNFNFSLTNIYWSSRSEAYTNFYKLQTRDSKRRLSALKSKISKPVLELKRENEGFTVIRKYDSIAAAAKEKGVSSASISRCLKNQMHMSAGSHWMYAEKKEEGIHEIY